MPADDKTFEALAENTLHDLMDKIDDALGDQMDVDLEAGILNIELENGGQYVINKQAPNKEIWVSSPLSGAKHFTFDDNLNSWVDTRGGAPLYDLLAAELAQVAGKPFNLK